MGFRDGIRKPGGGILHGVIGMLTGYRITTETPWDQKSRGEGKELLYLELTIRADGADMDTVQPLFLGSQEYINVSEDEQSFTSEGRDKTSIGAETGAGKFLASALDADFPEDRLPDLSGGDAFSLTNMVGTRFLFEQRVNEALTASKGKKDGKWNYTDLVVSEVVSLPQAKGKTNGAAKTVKGGKAKSADVDVSELAADTLREVMSEIEGDSLPFKKLKMLVFAKFGKAHPQKDQRDAVGLYLGDPTNLIDIDGIDFNGKTQTISLS